MARHDHAALIAQDPELLRRIGEGTVRPYLVIRVIPTLEDLLALPSTQLHYIWAFLREKGMCLDQTSILRVWEDAETKQRIWEETIYRPFATRQDLRRGGGIG